MEERKNFRSKLGIILASAGGAVGLGNVWRFPTEVGNNGGAAFILIYILCVVFIGLPVMLSEFVIGRSTHSNAITAFSKLAPGSWWRIEGIGGVFVAFLILSYYVVISGWTLFYMAESLVGALAVEQDYQTFFTEFVSHPWLPIVFLVLVLLLSHIIIMHGVQSGIERCSKIFMPVLFVCLCILVVCALRMPGASDGISFLLKPDFSKVTANAVLSAMGQAFFSLSLAMGSLCTYASYFSSDARLVKTAAFVGCIDTIVAVLSGFIIFPAVFSVSGVAADAGPGLVFITLPNVFTMAFHGYPILGYVFSGLFYLLLLLAALTSAMSLHESVAAYVLEVTHIKRKTASALVAIACATLGAACSLSFGPWEHVTCFGMTIFDLFDFISSKILLPIGGILICLFVGWRLDRKLVYNEVTNKGQVPFKMFRIYIMLIRYVVPLAIALIFVNELFS